MSLRPGPLPGWRLSLRIARRDVLRHRGRSALTLVMIMLPVLAVTSADVLIHTESVSGAESRDRRIGGSQALVAVQQGTGVVTQGPDPGQGYGSGGDVTDQPMATATQVDAILDGARLLEVRHGEVEATTEQGRTSVDVTEADLADPLAQGLFRLTSGRLPSSAHQVVINSALAADGYAVGDALDLGGAVSVNPTVVGIAESTTSRTFPIAAGPLGALGVSIDDNRDWLVGGDPVPWATVLRLNQLGATVTSRVVIDDPPPAAQASASTSDGDTVSVVLLVVVMALIEVVLLAGPAFAVGARQQQRALALLAASGGTPRQARRVVVAGALVLGSVAAAMGVGLGIVTAWLAEPLLQQHSDMWFGPFELRWLELLGVAGFGLLSAFLAALVPAWLASRQDVVAVLAGRRGDAKPSLRSPILGLALLAVGVAGSASGASQASGETLIAASAIPAVLGMVLLVPVVLAGLARVSGRLPLVLRYAVRDANRHRSRTVPAVAAVAATVAGVVALSIGMTSDQRENEETYVSSVTRGVGIVSTYGDTPDWAAIGAALAHDIPGATITDQQGLSDENASIQVTVRRQSLLSSSGDALGADVMVSDGPLPVGLVGVAARDVPRAEQALAAGGAVVLVSPGVTEKAAVAQFESTTYDPDTGKAGPVQKATSQAILVTQTQANAGPAAIVSTRVAKRLAIEPVTVAVAISGVLITTQQQHDAAQGVAAVSDHASLRVERGYQPESGALILQLVLIALGAVLMLGGTLTATFLALSDARPDLATLAAVGASPRRRRGIAAAYAVVVGLVGAVLGAAVGFIPGIAVAFPLTRQSGGSYSPGGSVAPGTGPYIDVPWVSVLVLVVALPLLTALVVGLLARSRLPLVARLP